MTATVEIDRTKLYGLTHNAANGKALTRQVRMLKVGIGYTKGPAIHVYIDKAGQWVIEEGVKQPSRKTFATLPEAKKYYTDRRRAMQADIDKNRGSKEAHPSERRFPGKFPYFTFLRTGMDGSFWPDFEAIERHGSMPDEIEIVFLSNSPLEQSMQWWTAAELKCEGNGMNALRRNDLASGPLEQKAAQEAKARGEKFFPIVDGCYARGCRYAQEQAGGKPPVCKPHSRLNFQLAYNPMLGGTAVFDTTGWRSGSNLFSCLEQIRTITGRGNPEDGVVAGIPLRLVLRPYRTSHNGQPSTQYGVSLQLRAEDAAGLMRKAIGQAEQFKMIVGAPRLLEAASEEVVEHLTEQAEARAISAEFYPEAEPQQEWDEYPDGESQAQPAAPQQQDDGRSFKAPQRKTKEQPVQEGDPEPDPPAADDPCATLLETFRAADIPTRGQMLTDLRRDLKEAQGDDSEWTRVLSSHGIRKPSEIKTAEQAEALIRDLYLALLALQKSNQEPSDEAVNEFIDGANG